MIIRFILTSLFLFFTFTYSVAQYNDFGNWNSFSTETKLVKKLKLNIGVQMRLNENISQVKTLFTDIDVAYGILDNSKIFVSYRLGTKRQLEGYYLLSQRFSLGFSAKKQFNDWKFGYRFKVQQTNNSIESSDYGFDFSSGFRNKISLNRKLIKKTYGWSTFELFSTRDIDKVLYISDCRWKIGIDRKIKKRHYFSLGFMVQRELQSNDAITDYIVLLGYEIKMKRRKKAKKNLYELELKSSQK